MLKFFFGRGQQIRKLFRLITDENLATNPIILLYGQSGVGKSSLLAAGLVPRLEKVAKVCYFRCEEANSDLTDYLRQALNVTATDLRSAWTINEDANRPLVVILDQVDKIYIQSDRNSVQEMTSFLDSVQSIFDKDSNRWPKGKLILGFRKEWLAEIRDRLEERDLPYKEMFLKHLDRRGIIEAIRGPATVSRLQVQYDLIIASKRPGEAQISDIIADDLLADRGSAIAPTLQIILTKLWESATGKPKVFDRDLYDNLRLQPANFLGQLLDQQLASLANQHPKETESGLVLDLLVFHTTSVGTSKQRTRTELEQAYRHLSTTTIEQLVKNCVNHYLLVDPSGDIDEDMPNSTRLSHDTLGPLIRARFDASDKSGQRARRILEGRSVEWKDRNDNPVEGPPLDEQDLSTVENGQIGMRRWENIEARIIEASRLARKKREQERMRQERERRLWIRVGIGLIAAIVIAAAVAFFQRNIAVKAKEIAEREAKIALSRQLAIQSEAEFDKQNYMTSLLLAIEAGQAYSTTAAFAAQRRVLPSLGKPLLTFQHDEAVNQAIWNRDETQILSASHDGTACVWDVALGQQIFKLQHDGPVRQVSWSTNEDRILTGSEDGTARVWNALSGQQQYELEHDDLVRQAVWSHSGNLILTASDDGTARIWDASDGKPLHLLKHNEPVGQATWNSNDTRILTVSGNTAWVWNATTGDESFKLSHEKAISQAIWNAKESQLLTASSDSTVVISDATTGHKIHTLQLNGAARQAVWNASESLILTASASGIVQVWDASSGQEVFSLSLEARATQVAWNNDESHILTASSDGKVRIWDADSKQELLSVSGDRAQFNSDEDQILTTDSAGVVRLRNVTSDQEVVLIHEGIVTQASWNKGENQILTASHDGMVRVWEARPGEELRSFPHVTRVNQAVWSSDENQILTASGNTAWIWNVNSGELIFSLPHSHTVSQVLWNQSENYILTSSDGMTETGSATVWDAQYGQRLITLLHHGPVNWSRWNGDESLILTASGDLTARVWDATSGKELSSLLHQGAVRSATWNRDESLILTASSSVTETGSAQVWDATSGKELLVFSHEGLVWHAAWNSDESQILTASDDGTAKIWDATSGKELLVFSHEGLVWHAAWSGDESRILTASNDGLARVWDVTSGDLLFSLQHDDHPVERIAWNEDGSLILTASDDGTIRVWNAISGALLHSVAGNWAQWNADESKLLARDGSTVHQYYTKMSDLLTVACAYTTRNLTKKEWQNYFLETTYNPTCSEWPAHPSVTSQTVGKR